MTPGAEVDHPRFIDFETVCTGPVEWDLAHLEREVADVHPEVVDAECLALCRTLVGAKTAVWCWEGLDAGPDMRWHAEHHTGQVRKVAL